MKPRIIITGTLAWAMVALGAAGCASDRHAQAALRAQARTSQMQAEQTALTHAPGGTIKQSELENDNGKLIWWFDIVTPGSKTVTEVSVDAMTGGVISVATETGE